MKVNTTIVLDTRNTLKNGKHPCKLRVTYNRKQKYFTSTISLTQDEFNVVMGPTPKGELKKSKMKLNALEQKANDIIDKMTSFNFPAFTRKMNSDSLAFEDVYIYFNEVIKSYKKQNKWGTASNYSSSLESLKKFKPSKLSYNEITIDFLKSYENWLLEKGKSISTVGIYLRPLRAILNRAMAEEIISNDFNYPFGGKNKLKYQIPSSRNIKKALSIGEIELLYNYKAKKESWEKKSLDMWLFSYLANGMNMKDIANLKYKDIDGEYIKFIRSKTISTNHIVTPISVFMGTDIRRIIKTWGNKDKSPENFIFPILSSNDSLERQRLVLQQFIKMVNKNMKSIATELKIEKPITTYYARHSFSTILKRSGASTQQISEALGHSSEATTRSYLDSFEDETKKEMAKALTNFSKLVKK